MERKDMQAEVIEPTANLSKVPEPAITYTLPTVTVGNLDQVEEFVTAIEGFFDGIEIDVTDKEQVKNLKGLNAEVNKVAKAINGKRLEMDKAVKGAIAEADSALNGLRDRLNAVAERNKGMLAEAEELWKTRRFELLEAEYEGVAPDLMAVIPATAFTAREPKLMQHSWNDVKACKEFDEMVAKAVEGRERLKAMNLEHHAEADYAYCMTLDIDQAIDRDVRLRREDAEKAEFAKRARELERRIEFKPVDEPYSPPKLYKWTLSFVGTDEQAEEIKRFMVQLSLESRSIRKEQA